MKMPVKPCGTNHYGNGITQPGRGIAKKGGVEALLK
jgi:hypothetical protein